jgi:ABC-type iron transport system FetAB ATPase subunit
VGVVGPAGAGKSFLCGILCHLCNTLFPGPEGAEWAVVLSMDGYVIVVSE